MRASDEEMIQIKSIARQLQNTIIKLCPLFSKILCILFFGLFTSVSYYGYHILFQQQHNKGHLFWVWFLIYTWIVFNTCFNYVMTTLTKPGSPSSIPNQIIQQIDYHCKSCHGIKPPRTHHCSICKQCVLQMDHHCPWVGGCVGHHNRRYFLNFLTYITSGLAVILLINHQSQDMVVLVFLFTLFCCLLLFTLFHWYLALAGKTTIQGCWNDPRYYPHHSLSMNLKIIFGTSNIFYCLLPSIEVLNNWGDQWQVI